MRAAWRAWVGVEVWVGVVIEVGEVEGDVGVVGVGMREKTGRAERMEVRRQCLIVESDEREWEPAPPWTAMR